MLVTLQFPIADARQFDADPDLRLKLPDWPDPTTGLQRQFVNRFGPAVERRRDPDLSYPDEGKYCLARRAVRFSAFDAFQGAGFAVDCAFRRLLVDGAAVVRVEIGFRTRRGHRPLEEALTSDDYLRLADRICQFPSIVGDDPSAKPLVRQGDAMARLFARSTCPAREKGKHQRAADLVEAGTPLLVIEVDPSQHWDPGVINGFTRVPPERIGGAALLFGRLRTKVGPLPIWILKSGADRARARLLRLCLLRLHAEQEALDITIKQVKRGRIPRGADDPAQSGPDVADTLDAYFNQKTRLLKRDEWHGVSQSAVLEAFDAAESVARVTSRLTLASRYEGARQQVWKKVQDYSARRAAIREVHIVNVSNGGTVVEKQIIANTSGVGNVVNVAEYMSDVRTVVNNNLSKAEASDEVKSLLRQLGEQIEAIGPRIDPRVVKQMGQDLSTLSSEVASPEPRRKWYELTLSGMKEAAEAVGAIAAPVVATVAKLMPLLLGAA